MWVQYRLPIFIHTNLNCKPLTSVALKQGLYIHCLSPANFLGDTIKMLIQSVNHVNIFRKSNCICHCNVGLCGQFVQDGFKI